ncbi:MAG: glycosyltransferase [Prevotella sp.]|nr:glycosyltransferase [Prevotella sp.]
MKITIVTTTYNSASTLRDTMESVLAQTHKDIEYWVIDGGSEDDTLGLIKEYEPLFDGRMKWISEPDNGLYDALNKGISRATGDVVGILNSDDFYTSHTVLEQVAAGFSDDVDAVYGDIHFVRPSDLDKCVRYYSSKLFRPWALRFGFMPAHPSFYVRREVYGRCGGYAIDYKLAADYDMMVRLFYKEKIRYRYLPVDMVTMRTGGMSTKNVRNRLLLTKEDVKACRRYGLYSNFLMCSCKYAVKLFEFSL